MNLDMTKGSPLKLILRFAFPLVIGNQNRCKEKILDTDCFFVYDRACAVENAVIESL